MGWLAKWIGSNTKPSADFRERLWGYMVNSRTTKDLVHTEEQYKYRGTMRLNKFGVFTPL